MATVIPFPVPLPVPSPERLTAIFAFTDALSGLYGPDRRTWPPAEEWPFGLLQGGAMSRPEPLPA
jgi:hypothetical protein